MLLPPSMTVTDLNTKVCNGPFAVVRSVQMSTSGLGLSLPPAQPGRRPSF